MRGLLLALVLGAAATLAAGCADLSGSVSAAYIATEVRGDVALAGSSGSNLSARQLGIDDDLGLGDDRGSLMLRGALARGPWQLRASGFRHDDSAESVLAAPFGDFAAGTPVSSDVELLNVKAGVSYDLVQLPVGELGSVTLAPGLAADYLDLDVDVRGTVVAGRESVANEVVVPLPFLLGEVVLGPAFLTVDFGGMAGDLGDGRGTYWDLDATLGVRPDDRFELYLGYRWIRADVRGRAGSRDYDADLDVGGLYVGAGVRF